MVSKENKIVNLRPKEVVDLIVSLPSLTIPTSVNFHRVTTMKKVDPYGVTETSFHSTEKTFSSLV
ncbi:CLUMA_CG015557, isoform A [Clunio marinus]|uniref:CLUMA_CG015557, isoform A n=1 Tax=Clunio marinus TaxID=568069 RepID=A0A1J1IQZ3_9DIPT|nr:CLUMA_CG015557, isoform A [Clunio marinus]